MNVDWAMGEQFSISKHVHVVVCSFVYPHVHVLVFKCVIIVTLVRCTKDLRLSHRCVGDMYTLTGIAIMICLMQDGATPLFSASQRGLTEVVNLLISHGASLDKQLKVDSYCDDYLVYTSMK